MSNSNCAAHKYLTREKKHDTVKHLGLGSSNWTKRLKSNGFSINMSNANSAAQNYQSQEKKHDPVNHLGLGNSDWTKRLKSHDLYQRVQYQLRNYLTPMKEF